MKRFLSLVLSALFVLQLGNANCDAASHYRDNVQNYSMGATPQDQPRMIMQASPYVPQQHSQPARPYCPQNQPTQTVIIPEYVQPLPRKNGSEKKSVLSSVFSILLTVLSTVVSIGVGLLSGAFSMLGNALKSLFNRDNTPPKEKEKEKEENKNNQNNNPGSMCDCCEELIKQMEDLRTNIQVGHGQLNNIDHSIKSYMEMMPLPVPDPKENKDRTLTKFLKFIQSWLF